MPKGAAAFRLAIPYLTNQRAECLLSTQSRHYGVAIEMRSHHATTVVKVIRKSLIELVGQIIGVCTHAIRNDYPTEFSTYDEAWENLRESIDYLRPKLGASRHAQLVDMAQQAKTHFELGHSPNGIDSEITLGARLMQDMEQVVKGKAPFAYPSELYRWGPEPRSPTRH